MILSIPDNGHAARADAQFAGLIVAGRFKDNEFERTALFFIDIDDSCFKADTISGENLLVIRELLLAMEKLGDGDVHPSR